MALTPFQRRIVRLLAEARRTRGESYVAGGVALNTLLSSPRVSRDIDLFHDTDAALAASWAADREALETSGLDLTVARESPSFVEAVVEGEDGRCAIEWERA